MVKRILIIVGIILVLSVALDLFLRSSSCRSPVSNIASQDSLTYYKNKFGEETARRQVLVGSIEELKNMNAHGDSLLMEIQKRNTRLTLQITAYKIALQNQHSTPTEVVYKDSVANDSVVNDVKDTIHYLLLPTYKSSYADKWENYTIEADKDSVRLKHTAFLYPIVEHRYINKGIFHPPEIELHISDQNPNAKVMDAQSFVVPQKRTFRGIYFTIGIGIGAIAAIKLLQ